MKRIGFIVLELLFLSSILFSQPTQPKGETFAIVVGISTYRHIKPLNYADRDADLFTDLLRSPAGGSIKEENLVLLKNDSANGGNFWSALMRICNKNLVKGDRVYIYFAGHGDAIKGLNEYYLLLADCVPANDANNYLLSFGAIDMYRLKNRIGLLTAKGVEVVLILDACRTNELTGGYASQAFNSSINQTKVGEIAMLATGPGQVSIEDASFGSGHGLFTYNLIDALSGYADKEFTGNNDKLTSLQEISDWVGKKVGEMSVKFKVNQNPVFCCEEKNNTTIGIVDSSFSVAWNQFKQLNSTGGLITRTGSQRNNDLKADSSLLELFNQFNSARKESRLWGEASADLYYEKMHSGFPNERLTEDARYALAADFINFAQQKINLYLEGKDLLSLEILKEKKDSVKTPDFLTAEYDRLKKAVSEKWTVAGLMIQKAGKLLSTAGDSTMLLQLKPRINFLLARGYLKKEKESRIEFDEAMKYAMEAYRADSSAAYIAECLGLLYAYKATYEYTHRYEMKVFDFPRLMSRLDSAMRFFKKASVLAPGWANPYRSIGLKVYTRYSIRYDSSLSYMRKAISLDPSDANNYILIGDLLKYNWVDSAVYYYKMAIPYSPRATQSDLYTKIAQLFFRYPAGKEIPKFHLAGRKEPIRLPVLLPDSVRWYARKSLAINPSNPAAFINLGDLAREQNKEDSAFYFYRKAHASAPENEAANWEMSWMFNKRRWPDSAHYYVQGIYNRDPYNYIAAQTIAAYYDSLPAKLDSAILYYQRARPVNGSDLNSERLAYLLMTRNREDTRALFYFKEPLENWPGGWRSWYNVACYYSNKGDLKNALENLEQALKRGMRNKKLLDSDPWLINLRKEEAYRQLQLKYSL